MATDHNFKVKNGLHVEAANTKIVDAGSGNAKLEVGGTLSIRPEGTTSNKHFFELNDYTAAGTITGANLTATGNVAGATMSTTGDTDFGGRGDFAKDLRIRGNGNSANQGVVRFHVDSSNNLLLDPANDGNNQFTFSSSGDLTIPGNLTVSGDTITANVATLDVEDKNITINYSTGDSSSTADGAGITIQDAVNSSTDATILWDATNDNFLFSHSIKIPQYIIHAGDADTFLGFPSANEIYFQAGNIRNLDLKAGEAVFNEGAADVDFRVESDNNTHMLYVDAGNDKVGIGTSSPAVALDIAGSSTTQMRIQIS